MLEQNTDRMWFVIGAVLISALLFVGLGGTSSESFGKISDAFSSGVEEKSPQGESVPVKDVPAKKNIIDPANVVAVRGKILEYDESGNKWTVELNPRSEAGYRWSSGLSLNSGGRNTAIPFGQTYTLSYEIYVSKDIKNPTAYNDINNALPTGAIVANDYDDIAVRNFNGTVESTTGAVSNPLKPGRWNKVFLTYSNTSAARNPGKVTLTDWSNIGMVNDTDKPMIVSIRNLKGELSKTVTPFIPFK